MHHHDRERGFSLIEVLICSAISAIAIGTGLLIAQHLAGSAQHLDSRVQAASATQAVLEQFDRDVASAWAIWVPPSDALGAPDPDGHEVDFFAQDASHRTSMWGYCYDAATRALTRYTFAAGVAPEATNVYAPLDAFSATTLPATAIIDPNSIAYDPLFAGAHVSNQTFAFGTPHGASGGNALTRVHIVAAGSDVIAQLTSATAPSHFTVVVSYTPSPQPLGTPTPTPLPIAPFLP